MRERSRSVFGLAASALVSVLSLASISRASERLEVSFPDSATCFELWETRVSFPPRIGAWLARLPDTQVHDAYDADRDGTWLRLTAEIERDGARVEVPGFAMREEPGGAWQWRIRFAPRSWKTIGTAVRVVVKLEYRMDASSEPGALERMFRFPVRFGSTLQPGPLSAPRRGENPHYLVQTGYSWRKSTWLFGACRAWVVDSQDEFNDWYPHEWLDRETELLAPMRRGGFNLLNQWMAPWEFLLVHHDRAEFWKDDAGRFRRRPLPAGGLWSSYQCFDQGRAAAFDELVRSCEGSADEPPVYMLLSPLPHQCFQVKEHPWGGQESGWSPRNDAGKQTRERLNGLSGFGPASAIRQAGAVPHSGVPSALGIWDFFEADPRAPLDDWRSMLFDHTANFHRYVIARWGYSKAIGVWVLVDELDAVGDVVGDRRHGTGWWGHPSCDRWLADLVRMYKGTLRRSDGLVYRGDPFEHPLHAATTSFGGEAGRGGNIDWDGGPEDARPDVFGFHWYPHWDHAAQWTDVWAYTIDGVAAYADAPIGNNPRLISEFGAADRQTPRDEPSLLYPSLYHHAIWAAVFAGHAGTPMDWDDGKQFGELTWRPRKGIFDRESYPIDHVTRMKALRRFTAMVDPGRAVPCRGERARVRVAPEGAHTRVYALHERPARDAHSRGAIYGWLFTPRSDADSTGLRVRGLPAGTYQAMWFDPWAGRPVPRVRSATVRVEDPAVAVSVDAGPALRVLSRIARPFPAKSRLARGHDVAFVITPLPRRIAWEDPRPYYYLEGVIRESEPIPGSETRFQIDDVRLVMDEATAARLARSGEVVRVWGHPMHTGHKGLCVALAVASLEEFE